MNPEISIVIPTYNHLHDALKPCVESIMQYSDHDRIEVIVSANGCADGTESYVTSIGNGNFVKCISYPKPLGPARANNEGIKLARGKYVMLLNDDCLFLPQGQNEIFNKMTSVFEANADCGMVGVTKLYDGTTKYPFVISFCCMVKNETFKQIGLMDETYSFGGAEDVDFCCRLQKAGYELYQPLGADPESEGFQQGYNFPLYHKSGTTLANMPEHFTANQYNVDRNKEKYREPVKYSIIMVTHGKDSFQRCLRSVKKYTRFMNSEIIFVHDNQQEGVADYIAWFHPHGPYKFAHVDDSNMSYHDRIKLGLEKAEGEYVVVLHADATLLPQPRNYWLEHLELPFLDPHVFVTSPTMINGECSFWCFMTRRSLFDTFDWSTSISQHALSRNGKLASVGNAMPIMFGI